MDENTGHPSKTIYGGKAPGDLPRTAAMETGAGGRLRERQHRLKRVFRFRVRIGFGVVFR